MKTLKYLDITNSGYEDCVIIHLKEPIPLIEGTIGFSVRNVKKIYFHVPSIGHLLTDRAETGGPNEIEHNLMYDVSKPRVYKKGNLLSLRKYPLKPKVWLVATKFSQTLIKIKQL